MKIFRIRPDISGLVAVWELEQKKRWGKWSHIFKNPDIKIVVKMKDHLLKPESVFTDKKKKTQIKLRK
jgi:hypothetical protein